MPNCEIVHSVEEALALTKEAPEIMIVGGGEIYRLFYPLATKMVITYVKANLAGDTHFVKFDLKEWQESAREDFFRDDKHAYDYSFVTLERGKKRVRLFKFSPKMAGSIAYFITKCFTNTAREGKPTS